MRSITLSSIALVLAASTSGVAGPEPEQKCQGGQSQVIGKLAACITKADKTFVLKGDSSAYAEALAKCTDKHSDGWTKLTDSASAAGTSCYSELNAAAVQGEVLAFTECIAERASGAKTGNCFRAFPASGETTDSWGPGSDGVLEPGATMSFVDNGDGTITDMNTGLTWEKKDDSGGIHDKDNGYRWWDGIGIPTLNGTVVTTFLNTLNDTAGGGANCFAGHCDWRLPTIKELASLVDFSKPIGSGQPMIPEAFHRSATCTGCTVIENESCSCTNSIDHWSSTSAQTGYAWQLYFGNGEYNSGGSKNSLRPVRAVRGGL